MSMKSNPDAFNDYGKEIKYSMQSVVSGISMFKRVQSATRERRLQRPVAKKVSSLNA